jgi:hypothetical protein
MLGKDARSKLAIGAATVVAAVGLGSGTAQAHYTGTPADPFIQVQEVVTNVGQRPHVVVTYGNAGGRTLLWVEYGCRIKETDGSVRDLKLTYDTYRSPLLAGQNANFEFVAKAVKRGKTKIQCSITAVEDQTGKHLTVLSNVSTIRVL